VCWSLKVRECVLVGYIIVLVHVGCNLLVCESVCVGFSWCVSVCVLDFVGVSVCVLEFVGL